jgi:autotransporter-associated beta strand protein
MKSNHVTTCGPVKNLVTETAKCAGAIGVGLIALLFVFLAMPSAQAQTLQFTLPTTRVTVPVNFSNVVTIPINNTANTNGLAISTNGASLDINGFYHLDPVNLNVSGLPAGVTYSITSPDGVALTQIGNASTNVAHLGYETNNYHTNLLVNLFCTNVAQGEYTFYLNAGGDGSTTLGLPTNSIPFILQAAHIWNGNGGVEASFGVSNNWVNAGSWLGGAPGVMDDVVIADAGGQTNTDSFASGFGTTNIGISSSITVGSLRFASTVYTNLDSTNGLVHTMMIAPNVTLTVTNGFRLLRDYIIGFGQINDRPDRPLNVNIVGSGPNATLFVSNSAADFTVLHAAASSAAGGANTLNMSNLTRFVACVSRMGIADYQLFPNYAGLNKAYNGNAGDTNEYNPRPNSFSASVYLARTNFITATYKDPNNYTNEDRTYALSFEHSERQGLGATPNANLLLGLTNKFFLDSVAFVRANHQGFVRFNTANSGAIFRGTNGTDRLSVFAVSDDGGTTNMAASNVKATVDFAGNNGLVDLLADRFYIARDRTAIVSNNTPNVQGDMIVGRGNVDVNTAYLGFQEHSNKVDWKTIYGYPASGAYLNYCQGRLIVTNGGTFRVNKTLTLGYTADTNPQGSAQQNNTFGRLTVYAGSTAVASNIVCDTGLNWWDNGNPRQNQITLDAGTLMVSNTIGGPSANQNVPGGSGLPLDTLTMQNGGTLSLFVAPGKTNIFVRTLTCVGTTTDTLKIANLITNGLTFPTNLPIISYNSATPLLQADMTSSGIAGVYGYILNDSANKLIALYLTTIPPKALRWTGSTDNKWDLTTANWVPVAGGSATTFTLGDTVTFDDTTDVTNINVATQVNPGVMTVINSNRVYAFSGSGAIVGTAALNKDGTNTLAMNVTCTKPVILSAGSVVGSSAGAVGSVTIYSNAVPSVLDFSGVINGSVTASNAIVTIESGGSINSGNVKIDGGVFVNRGTVTLPLSGSSFLLLNGASATNEADSTIYTQTGNSAFIVNTNCTLANFGMINTYGNGSTGGRVLVYGLYFGTGTIYDPVGGTSASPASGRLTMQDNLEGIISPGATPTGSISNMNLFVRFDLRNNNGNSALNNVETLLIEVDQNLGIYDTITCDKWNNLGGRIWMTNLNGSFTSGQIFHVLKNTIDGYPNGTDTGLSFPLMWPPVPGPGLQWNISRLQIWGDIMVTNSAMIWSGAASSIWNTNGSLVNWSGLTYSDWQGAVFDERAGNFNVQVTTTVAPAGFNTFTITNTGVSTNTFTNFPSFMPGIVVSNSTHDYVINSAGGKISGQTSIYKTGSGTLTLLGTNDFTGGIIVDGGTLAYTNRGSLGAVTGGAGYQQLILDNSTLKYFGMWKTNVFDYPIITINKNGATVEVVTNNTGVRLTSTIYGSGALTKTGQGELWLTSANRYTGDTTLSEGVLQLQVSGGAGAGGTLTVGNNTTLQVTNASGFSITNLVVFAGNAVVQEISPTRFVADALWTGSGTLTFSNGPTDTFVFNGALTNLTGVISLGNSTGKYLFNNTTNKSPCLGSAFATFDLGTGSAVVSNMNGGGLTYDLGGLAGGANTILAGRATNNLLTNATTIYRIGAKGVDTTFSGKIVNGIDDVVTVVKVGSGKLLLNGANTYTGSTTVSNGTLGGTGSIAGALTVVSGATLAPGASIGTFTVSGAATLNGTLLMELDRNNSPATNDQLSVGGAITASGTLVVTNIGQGLYNNSTFKLFNKAVTGLTVFLPAKDPTGTTNYTWATNITADGSITLVAGGLSTGPNTDPFVMTNSYSSVDGTLTLGWPENHTGYRLLSNSVSLVNTSMWFQVVNAELTNKVILTVKPTETNVFFRLIYPYP